MGLLDGQKAIVTGGGSGIGRATCRRMAEEGAQVAVFDLNGESAEAVAEEIGGIAFGVDVGDPDALRRCRRRGGGRARRPVHHLQQRRHLRLQQAARDGPGRVGPGAAGEPDRRLGRHPGRRAPHAGRRRRLHRQHGVHQRDEAGGGGEPLRGQQGGRGRTDRIGRPGVRADHPGQRRLAGHDPDGHDRADVRVHAQPDGALRDRARRWAGSASPRTSPTSSCSSAPTWPASSTGRTSWSTAG